LSRAVLDISAYPDTIMSMHHTAQLFKALSEVTRLRILSLLSRGELCVCEIEAGLELPQSTISRHLGLLRQTGLVHGRRKGVWMHYRLAEPQAEVHKAVVDMIHQAIAGLEPAAGDRARLKAFQAGQPCPEGQEMGE